MVDWVVGDNHIGKSRFIPPRVETCAPVTPQEVREREAMGRTIDYETIASGTDVVRFKENAVSNVEENLRQALALFASQTALAGRFGGKQPPVGTVLRWVKKYDARKPGEIVLNQEDRESVRFTIEAPTEYVYVAFRAPNDAWYITGNKGGSRLETDWDRLLKDIGDSECQLVSEWVTVPIPEKPSEELLDPINWAQMMFGKRKRLLRSSAVGLLVEIWLPVPGWEGFYEVSDQGRVRSVDRVVIDKLGRSRHWLGQLLSPYLSDAHYPLVNLARDGTRKTSAIHQLMALAFIGPCPPGHEVLHRDDVPDHNVMSNLRYGTRVENLEDRVLNGNSHRNGNSDREICNRRHLLIMPNLVSCSLPKRVCKSCTFGRSRFRRRPDSSIQILADQVYVELGFELAR